MIAFRLDRQIVASAKPDNFNFCILAMRESHGGGAVAVERSFRQFGRAELQDRANLRTNSRAWQLVLRRGGLAPVLPVRGRWSACSQGWKWSELAKRLNGNFGRIGGMCGDACSRPRQADTVQRHPDRASGVPGRDQQYLSGPSHCATLYRSPCAQPTGRTVSIRARSSADNSIAVP